jgi:hypothetical protein
MKNILLSMLPQSIKTFLINKKQNKIFKKWKQDGCSIPPPHDIKRLIIRRFQKKYEYKVLIETGTFRGDMVEAQKTNFKKIISIELGIELYEKAKQRFANDKNVLIIQGDSGKVLPSVLDNITEPVIFWLDGHYSSGVTALGDKECPIFEELNAIFNSKRLNHVLLIDDARLFNGEGDYPTIEDLTKYIRSKNENYKVEVKYDIISYVI